MHACRCIAACNECMCIHACTYIEIAVQGSQYGKDHVWTQSCTQPAQALMQMLARHWDRATQPDHLLIVLHETRPWLFYKKGSAKSCRQAGEQTCPSGIMHYTASNTAMARSAQNPLATFRHPNRLTDQGLLMDLSCSSDASATGNICRATQPGTHAVGRDNIFSCEITSSIGNRSA